MSRNLALQDALKEFSHRAMEEWSSKLRELLESKHLYQHVEADIPGILSDVRANTIGHQLPMLNPALANWMQKRLLPGMKVTNDLIAIGGGQYNMTSPILLATNSKLFCTVCKSPEVFSPLWARDASGECVDHRSNPMPRDNDSQLFFLALQCQRCGSDPDGFIVRRKGTKLYLEGRSPMEHVEVAKYLPKVEAHFFGDALVAFNAGKKLAAFFYLRVFLEQFARRITGEQGRTAGETLMDAYTATLPKEHRDHMPSLREWYEKLSAVIHSATEDDDLFNEAKLEIDRHFDIRRVYKIPETS